MISKWTNHTAYQPLPETEPPIQAIPIVRGSLPAFVSENKRLLGFSILFLAGALCGMLIFAVSGEELHAELSIMLSVGKIAGGLTGGVSAFFSSCFSTTLLLCLLFLAGLSACGAPVALAVPFFSGLGLGMTEAYYYTTGISGILLSALLVLPPALMTGAALVMGSMESVRMSLLFSRQLLPSGRMGGLWSDFKLYAVRFLIFFIISVCAGILDVALRITILPALG